MLSFVAMALAAGQPVATAEAPITSVDPIAVPGSASAHKLLVRITAPVVGRNLPVILLSHGNRLSREDYRPLVEYWARSGYVVVQPDHADASTDGFPPAANPPGMWQTRVEDMHRTLDALSLIVRRVPGLSGRVAIGNVAMVGHSLGGLTTMMIDGAKPKFDAGAVAMADPRIKAILLLAPTGDGADLAPAFQTRSPYVNVDFSTMRGPVFLVAGGADDAAPMAGRGVAWRRDPYRLSPSGSACMIVVAGAGHYLGGINGPAMRPEGDATPERLRLVRETTTRFLDASLKGEGGPFRAWLPTQATQLGVESAECR
jgi:predicted dienelactone hydrolase